MDFRTGESITAAQLASGVFTWEVTNPLSFKITDHDKVWYQHHIRWPKFKTTIRIMLNHSLKKVLGIHKAFLDLTIYHRFTQPIGMIFSVFKNQVVRYLNNLGVISIGNVLKACEHVLFKLFKHVDDVTLNHNVQYKLY
uniref:Replication enhancer n=1 Tax=Kudzu mosaic virus TaxID=390437 RepID=B8YJH3_9GEMI|nr:AC3 [Kudzu mosaic virus]